jgi:hypothetical protein
VFADFMKGSWSLAGVLRSLVHIFQHGSDAIGKDRVAIAAPKAAGLFKVCLCESADGTFMGSRRFFNFLGSTQAKQEIGKGKACRIVNAFLFRATFTEVHFLHFPIDDLRQENGGLLSLANIALHFIYKSTRRWMLSTRGSGR